MRAIPKLHYSLNLEIGIQQSQNNILAAVRKNTNSVSYKIMLGLKEKVKRETKMLHDLITTLLFLTGMLLGLMGPNFLNSSSS